MLLTISTTHRPATDLGYLLHKHPGRLQSFPLSFGQAHVFYPEATEERCTAALLLDVDPVGLVRRSARGGFALDQYVNDRPYVASSFLSVAIGEVFGTAMSGRSREREDLAAQAIPLSARLSVLPCRSGDGLLHSLFEPLGYVVDAKRHALDPRFPDWGNSRYHTVELTATTRLRDLLTHLTVLVPVLDDDKHYWVGEDELEKLLRRGEGWLSSLPERELIVERYLKRRRGLVREAIARLAGEEETEDPDEAAEVKNEEEEAVEKPIKLHTLRLETVARVLHDAGATRVLDLGCGEGKLIRLLLEDQQFRQITGVDVSPRALEIAARRLKPDRAPARGRLTLLHGALTYCDRRLEGYDAAAVVEVIEHLDLDRLAAFERALFDCARPNTVVITTPNIEYNALFANMPAGRLRHRDHRFEWTRAEFQTWANAVAARYGYTVRFEGIGPEDPVLGTPSQMAIFNRQTPDPS